MNWSEMRDYLSDPQRSKDSLLDAAREERGKIRMLEEHLARRKETLRDIEKVLHGDARADSENGETIPTVEELLAKRRDLRHALSNLVRTSSLVEGWYVAAPGKLEEFLRALAEARDVLRKEDSE